MPGEIFIEFSPNNAYLFVFDLQYLYEISELVKVTSTFTGFPFILNTFHFPAILVTGVIIGEEDPYLTNRIFIFP